MQCSWLQHCFIAQTVFKLLKFTKACKRIYHYASSKNFDVFILCVFITGALYYALCKLILNQLIEKRFVRLCDQSHVRDAYSLQRWNPICNSACRRNRATSNNDQIKPLHFVNVQVKDSLFKQVQDRENRSVPTATIIFFCCAWTVETSWAEDLFSALDISPHVSTSIAISSVWSYLILVSDQISTIQIHGILNLFIKKPTAIGMHQEKSYGSQRPVVWFTVARGQYEPSGQADARRNTKSAQANKLISLN